MNTVRTLAKQNITQWRTFSRCIVARQTAAGSFIPSTPLVVPSPEGADKVYAPKLEKIATDISSLNLLEVSELSQLLKIRLNLPDQPMMPMGGFGMAQMAAAPGVEEEEVAPTKVKTEFTVKMTQFDEKQKVPLIKEIKNLLEGFNLVQAKKFVESLPAIVKADTTKEEAEKLKEALVKVGAVIEIL